MGNRLALLCDAPVPRILDAYARQGAVRRDMVARDEARGRNLPRAAAQGRTRTVQIPAPRAPAVGQSDARRLWPADEEDRADPLDVPPVGRCVPLSLPDPDRKSTRLNSSH